MNSKFLNAKYLAIVLLGFVILLLISFDAFSKERNETNLSLNGSTVKSVDVTGAINTPELQNVLKQELVINE